MKKILSLLLTTFGLLGCQCSDQQDIPEALHTTQNNTKGENTLSEAEVHDGWQRLFDGKTLNDWHGYGQSSPAARGRWRVQQGELQLHPDEGDAALDLLTDDEYAHFHLRIEWKITEKGNSGIHFHVKEAAQYAAAWQTGPEMQLLDNGSPGNPGHPDAQVATHRAGALYDLVAAYAESARPPGEWNQTDIIVLEEEVTFLLNGITIVQTAMGEEDWQDLLEASKFVQYPDFGSFASGSIALQDHGDGVSFRNIKIKRL